MSRRVKVSVTLNPEWLRAVDRAVAGNPALDRSKVIDEALALWCAESQARAMAEQFEGPVSAEEQEEQAAWHRIQTAAAQRIFSRDDAKS